MSTLINIYSAIFNFFSRYLGEALIIFIRFYVGWVFIQSGYKKAMNWDSTLYLFESEYEVPFFIERTWYVFSSEWTLAPLSFLTVEMVAIFGTVAEIILPIMLIVGLATRLNALALFFFNIIAVVSYPGLTEKGFEWFVPVLVDGRLYGAIDHQIWGIMLLIVIFYGQSKLSVDRFICQKINKVENY